jgi:hypothetical protein
VDIEYGRIYKTFYDELTQYPYALLETPQLAFAPYGAEIQQLIRAAIEDADKQLRKKGLGLRDDAKYLLFVNLMNMVALPILVHGDSYSYLPDGLFTDVAMLVSAAGSETAGRPTNTSHEDRQVSAHSVVDALAGNWNKLRLSAVGLWGSKPQFEE